MERDENTEARIYYDIIELVQDIARLGDNLGISHSMVPGGMETVNRAVEEQYIVVTAKSEKANHYGLTILGLFLLWNQERGELLRSRKIFDLIT